MAILDHKLELVLPQAATSSDAADWRLLQSLGLYRLLLVILLIMLQQFGAIEQFFEGIHPRTFYGACVGYAIVALMAIPPALYRRPRLSIQVLVSSALDALAVMTLAYASGGVPGGLGILLIPSVIGASLLLTTRLAMLVAAAATLASFGEELVRHYPYFYSTADFTACGVLGVMFFVTAGAANAVARRARASEALALRVGSEFEDLTRLNETVIDTMQTGVAVVDAQDMLRGLNHAGTRMLACGGAAVGTPLLRWSPALGAALDRWRAGSATPEEPIAPARAGAAELLPRFRRLGTGPQAPVLILLEDAARIREQAQQIKLAALGRLSASIAHEIRNPLSAITHAGQLLAESPQIPDDDRRLIDIIQRHGMRINDIIKDVLKLSRGAADQQVFLLAPWLQSMLAQYREAHPYRTPQLTANPALLIRFDPHHLEQILFNLLDNAYTHGERVTGAPQVQLSGQELYVNGGALEVSDNGPGVQAAAVDNLFEPFFTTTHNGTGLGLYLARELCAYNQAKLTHHPRGDGGAVFRVTFVAPGLTEPVT